MPFEWFVGLRFLWDQKAQSALIIAGVGVGVGVMVFLSALITGLQESLIDKTLGTQAHVVVSPQEEEARPLMESGGPEQALVRRVDRPEQRIRSIGQWQKVERDVARLAGVVATAPLVLGGGFAIRGNATEPIAVIGAEPDRFERVIPVSPFVTAGRYSVDGTGVVIGTVLAERLGITAGDKLRLQAAEGRSELFVVRGVFDLGNRQVNERWAMISLRSAQTLLGLAGGVTTIYVDVEDIYAATDVSDRIAGATGLVSESWMRTNAQLLTALRSQSASSTMIRFFVILAVAIGITSVLVVTVVQRSREIGILRAMGASTTAVLRAFLVQGAVIGLSGAFIGCVFGGVLAVSFSRLFASPGGVALFPISLTAGLFLGSTGIALGTGVLAAVFPARRAAKLEPAVAIRHV
jgi:lipoprotein-releasing system permease protein